MDSYTWISNFCNYEFIVPAILTILTETLKDYRSIEFFSVLIIHCALMARVSSAMHYPVCLWWYI